MLFILHTDSKSKMPWGGRRVLHVQLGVFFYLKFNPNFTKVNGRRSVNDQGPGVCVDFMCFHCKVSIPCGSGACCSWLKESAYLGSSQRQHIRSCPYTVVSIGLLLRVSMFSWC